jgi:uncharacterized protein (DUF2267 family)
MPYTGLAIFDRTLQVTHEWLNEIAAELGTEDKHKAYSVLRATLHAVRDLLTVDEAAQFGAEMPLLVRGIYYEGWKPGETRPRRRLLEDFVDRMRNELRDSDTDEYIEQAAAVVFKVVQRRVSAGEVIDVEHMLPEPVRALWP